MSRGSQPTPVDLGVMLEQHRAALYGFVRLNAGRLVLRRDTCGDIVQSVFRELLRVRDRFRYDGDAALRKWLCTTALRKIQDRIKYHRRQRRDVLREVPLEGSAPLDDEGSEWLMEAYQTVFTPSRDAMAREELARVEAAFEKLPPAYRKVITMCRIAGLDPAEVAAETGQTAEAVRVQLYRALARLAALLR